MPFEWEPPNGYPDVGGAWANTNGLLNRWNLGLGARRSTGSTACGCRCAASSAPRRPKTLRRLVDAMARAAPPAGARRRRTATRLVAYVGQGQAGAARRIPAWYLNQQAPGLIALILGSPYFQWR